MNDRNRIVRIANLLAGMAGLIAAVLISIGYFTISYKYTTGSLEAETEINSRIFSDLINKNPEMWQFEQMRLEELLMRRPGSDQKEIRRIVNLQNGVVAESVDPLSPPLITRFHPIKDSGITVARIEISRSMRPILITTALVACFALIVGLIIFVSMRILLFRAVVKAEQALRESEEKYRYVVENCFEAIRVFNETSHLYANPACLELLGYEWEELKGLDGWAVVAPERREWTRERGIRRLYGDDRISVRTVLPFVRKDGKRVIAEVAVSLVYMHGKPAIISCMRDITQYEQVRKNLQENKEKLQDALGKISELIQQVVTKKDFSVRFDNPNLTKCYNGLDCRKTICPCFGKAAMRCWQVAGTFCGRKVQGEFAGKIENCEKCIVFKEACQDPFCKIGEQFNNMMHILETKNNELQKAYHELQNSQAQILQQEKMVSVGQLAAGIAHEINTPTQFIGDNIRFLQDAFTDINRLTDNYDTYFSAVKAEHETEDLLNAIETTKDEIDLSYLKEEIPLAIHQALEGVERVAKIVRAMKEFSHPGTEGKTLVDLNRAIESTITVARNEWKYVAEMETEFDATLPPVPCFPGDINQVILNMIVNAAHAIGEAVGDGSTGNGTIRISTHRNGDFVEIQISDTGNGIAEGIRNRIFDPFFTTKAVGKGTGQGLAIAYSVIVDKHGGDLNVESEVGKGTCFSIRLPLNG